MSQSPGFIDMVKRVLRITPDEVRQRSEEVRARLHREIEMTSICARELKEELPPETAEILETVPPDRPAPPVDSGEQEN